jgi:hypothetical protein
MNTFLCGPKIYEYDGWIFEFHYWCGPWPLKKDLELRKRAGKKFWNMFEKFNKIPIKEKENYRVGGGCQVF